MKFSNPYLSTTTKIQMIEQWVLVHSFLYYEADSPIITDQQFDHNSRQLAEALRKYPKSASQTRYSYCFEGYDGSTGHHLFGLLKNKDKRYIMDTAYSLLNMMQKQTKERRKIK